MKPKNPFKLGPLQTNLKEELSFIQLIILLLVVGAILLGIAHVIKDRILEIGGISGLIKLISKFIKTRSP